METKPPSPEREGRAGNRETWIVGVLNFTVGAVEQFAYVTVMLLFAASAKV